MEGEATEGPSGTSTPGKGYVVAPSSPSGQKRPRDFGEELKGLTSDEEGQDSYSPRASKKKKTDHRDSDGASESLDDGEIAESGPSRPSSGHDAGTLSQRESPKTQGAGPPPAETDGLAGSTQQPVTGFNRGIVGVRTSFGREATALFPTARSASTNTSVLEQGTQQRGRTVSNASQSEGSDQAQAQGGTTESDSSPLFFNCGKSTWQIPRLEALKIPEIPEAQTEPFWRERLSIFIATLFQANDEPWDRLEIKSLRTALDKYVSKDGGFLRGAKTHMKAVRKAMHRVMANKQGVTSIIKKAREVAGTGQSQLVEPEVSEEEPGQVSSPGRGEESGVVDDEERRQQQKYFPNTNDPSQYCISCSGMGHGAGNCPKLVCCFCESNGHNSLGCPTKQRCNKCYQLGHSMTTCTEKLALTADEQDPCAFCGAAHLEDDCSEVWRSYDPANTTIKKVKAIPVFCYTCGNEGHCGPECALPGRRSEVTGRTSWSQANRDLYIDPQSDLVAIAWVGISTEVSSFQIRGRATRNTHTHFESDDDSDDDEFIREPIKKTQPRGQMRIATNIANGVQNGNRPRRQRQDKNHRRQQESEFDPPPPPPQNTVQLPGYNGNSAWQPPLPPGPPPPQAHLNMQRKSGHISPSPLSPPTFIGFAELPTELQDTIWEFALPRRTIYLHVDDLWKDKPVLPRHNAPAIARVSRDARAVATRTGRWLWFGPGGAKLKLEGRLMELQASARGDCPELIPIRMRRRVLWFDAARDTILIADLRLWPQDVEACPVALEMRLPIPDRSPVLTCDEGGHDAASQNSNTAVTAFAFSLNVELHHRRPCVYDKNDQLLFVFPSPEDIFQFSFDSPIQDITGGDLRLWPGHYDASSSSTATTAAEAPAYVDTDLEIIIERPLSPDAHNEFFPEGNTACFIDLSALEPLSSSPPPHLSSYSCSSPTPPAANLHDAPAVTRQTIARLLHAYTRTQDLDSKANIEKVKLLQRLLTTPSKKPNEGASIEALLQRLLLREETTPSEKPNEGGSIEAFFESKRRAIAFKWLRINWIQLPQGEREGPYMAGAQRGCSSFFPAHHIPWTSLNGSPASESSSSSPGPEPEPPTSAQPCRVYRMPRPWTSGFALPHDFNTEHPWTRGVLEAMPCLRLGLLLRLRGEAAAVAAGEPNARWLGRRRNVGGADVVKGGASL
ncbi:hypothetical protein SLS62_003267 [Diatrype stigma]|uniref:CCHC-type domain-containing protein n=1 Tax=Diatrype stigma TaxID=117547 RepID=A0AAN9V552_9PEZI